MNKPSTHLAFFLDLAKAATIASRRFDIKLSGWSMGFSDFLILYHLSGAEGQKLRRIDLAEKVGLTASGVTRQLAPMEKIGLVRNEESTHDARVRFVALAPGGKRMLEDSFETAEYISEEWLADNQKNDIKTASKILQSIGSYSVRG